jgi:hypothetical protein
LGLAVSFKPEDQVYVQIAIDECRKLYMAEYAPTALIWSSRRPIDQPFLDRNYLMMPEALNGKILPQEARPLIMSAIVQKERLKRHNPLDQYTALFVMVGTVFVVGSFLAIVAGFLPASIGGAVVLAWILYLFVGPSFLRLRNNRAQRLDSDHQVAQLIGSETFLQTLRKIENLNLSPRHGRIRSLLSGWPSLSQRIANLKNPTLPITEKDAFEAFQKK